MDKGAVQSPSLPCFSHPLGAQQSTILGAHRSLGTCVEQNGKHCSHDGKASRQGTQRRAFYLHHLPGFPQSLLTVGAAISPILQMKKLRLGNLEKLTQTHVNTKTEKQNLQTYRQFTVTSLYERRVPCQGTSRPGSTEVFWLPQPVWLCPV